jgi:hypothetical protein
VNLLKIHAIDFIKKQPTMDKSLESLATAGVLKITLSNEI